MEYIALKNSGLRVSRFCMGGCPMGGYGWGVVQKNELIDAIHQALESGINFFDTADTYGLGQSELTLAEGLGVHRRDVVIQSKFGVRVSNAGTEYDNSPAYIVKALEATLHRLHTDYVDIYTIHYRDSRTPIQEVVSTLRSLQQAGKIRYFGLSNIHGKDINELLPYKGTFVNCQDEFSLACRKNEQDLRNVSECINVTPLTWGSLGQGILTGKYTEDTIFDRNDRRSKDIYINFHGDKLKQNLRIVDVLKEIAFAHNKTIAACAIRFILDKLPDSAVIAGVKKPAQLESNIAAMGWSLSRDELQQLDEVSYT